MIRKVRQAPGDRTRRVFLQRSAHAALGLAAAGMAGIGWGARGPILHIRNYIDLESLDPVSSISFGEGIINLAINSTLLRFASTGDWALKYDAAEYFRQRDPTHYDFRLIPGLMFSHGFGEITADDVKFSFERLIDPAMHALNAIDMGPLEGVDVTGRYSGTFVLRAPYAAFETVGVAGASGSILSRAAVTAAGGRFTNRPPCSSGPYLLESWQAQRKTVLVRNPDWRGEPAPFEEIHVYAMADEKTGEMAFEAGQLDCAQISVETVEPFQRNMPPDSSLLVLPSSRNYWLGMNRLNPALTDLRVRRAIQYAIDAEAVVQAAWFGLADVSTGPIPAGMLGHRPRALIPPRGDRDKARALLLEAGVRLPLRLRLDVDIKAQSLTAVQVMQWSLRQVGIEVDIRAQDNSTFLTIGREDLGEQWRDVQLFMQNFAGSADPYYSMTWFISAQAGLWNWERFESEEFDRLNDAAIGTSNPEERSRMYHRMQDLMELSGCYRFLTNGAMPQIYRNTIEPTFRPDSYAQLRDFRPAARPA